MTPTIGFVGYGNINSALAKHAVKAGYKVVISNSRGPATLQEAVKTLGSLATAATVEDAVRSSTIVSVSLPLVAYKQLLPEIFEGKIIIDSMNYYAERDGVIEELENRSLTSSELVQRHFRRAHVVKSFNNITSFHLASGGRPVGSNERWALPLAGDDTNAKQEVTKFVEAIGFDVVDTGSLADSWRFEPRQPAYVDVYFGEMPETDDPAIVRNWLTTDHSARVTADDMRALVAKADRSTPVGGSLSAIPPIILKAVGL